MGSDAGTRDHLVTIQELTIGTASSGFPTTAAPVTLGTAWMRRRDVSGTERLAAAQLAAPVESEFEMLYQTDMDPERYDVPKVRRLLYRGRVYNIVRAVLTERSEGRVIRLFTIGKSGT